MPYNSVSELPDSVRDKYDPKAQRAYMKAFNSAWDGTCKDGGKQGDREGCSHAVAHTAAKMADGKMNKAMEFLKSLIGIMEEDYATEALDKHWQKTVEDIDKATKTDEWAREVPIVKVDHEKRIVYGPVLEPRTEENPDTDGDWYTAEEIERAAHRFMKRLAEGDAGADGVEHIVRAGTDKAHLVESWIVEEDTAHGEQQVHKGTWMVGVHLPDDELWQAAKDGTFTGFSIGGRGVRE